MSESVTSANYIELAADIVSAYVSNNSVPSSDLPSLINDIHSALVRVAGGGIERVSDLHRWPIFLTKRIMEEVCHGAAL